MGFSIVDLLVKNGREAVIETYVDLGADMNLHEEKEMKMKKVQVENERDPLKQKSETGNNLYKILKESNRQAGYHKRKSSKKLISDATELNLFIIFFCMFALICCSVSA